MCASERIYHRISRFCLLMMWAFIALSTFSKSSDVSLFNTKRCERFIFVFSSPRNGFDSIFTKIIFLLVKFNEHPKSKTSTELIHSSSCANNYSLLAFLSTLRIVFIDIVIVRYSSRPLPCSIFKSDTCRLTRSS